MIGKTDLSILVETYSLYLCLFWIYETISHACLLHRPLTASTRSACTALPSSQPTLCPRLHSEASTSVKPNRTFWKETCTLVISSCAHTPVSPTCPNHDRSSQVGRLNLYLWMLHVTLQQGESQKWVSLIICLPSGRKWIRLVQMTLIVSDSFSGCRSCFDAGWQLGGRETDRSGYGQRAGHGGGPGSDPQGTDPKLYCTLTTPTSHFNN